jgi:uncharacterized protein YjiS (DUF1127 family)
MPVHPRKVCTNGVVSLISIPPGGNHDMNANNSFDVSGAPVSPDFPSAADIDHHVEQTGWSRAGATADSLASAFRPILRGARALGARLVEWERRRATREALMGCSDRVLADIGIEREDIPLIARGLDPHDCDLAAIGWRGRWAWMRERLDATRQAARQQRQLYRELMAYRDHELDDLGIRRTDIPTIARGQLPAAA